MAAADQVSNASRRTTTAARAPPAIRTSGRSSCSRARSRARCATLAGLTRSVSCVDGAREALAGALDLLDQRIRVADRDRAIRLGHRVHPFSARIVAGK